MMMNRAFHPSTLGRDKAEAVVAALDVLDDFELLVVHKHIESRLSRAGAPIPPFTSAKAEAEAWAAIASLAELKIYTAAAVVRFSAADRACLAAYLGEAA